MYDKLDYSLKRANILKPQNAFEKQTDNFESESRPWKPILTKKPHAQVSLEQSLTTFKDEEDNTQYGTLSFKQPLPTSTQETPTASTASLSVIQDSMVSLSSGALVIVDAAEESKMFPMNRLPPFRAQVDALKAEVETAKYRFTTFDTQDELFSAQIEQSNVTSPAAAFTAIAVDDEETQRLLLDMEKRERKRAKAARYKARQKLRKQGLLPAPIPQIAGKTEQKANQACRYQHPYKHEITNLQYPSHVYESREPIKYLPIETTKAIWVDTYEGVLEMLEELKKSTEIAIDLEHHDFRSYAGLLSLMQISTQEKDWIVDTLVPWRHKLEVLNEVFADPKILKVLHGAFMDIIWLQRDLGLYVVGLFDTHHASDVLLYSGKSLAFLLKKFVDFDADKKYQLADWRIR